MIICVTIILCLIPFILLTPQLIREHRILKHGTRHSVTIHNVIDDGIIKELFFVVEDKELSVKVLPGLLYDPTIGDVINVAVLGNSAVAVDDYLEREDY